MVDFTHKFDIIFPGFIDVLSVPSVAPMFSWKLIKLSPCLSMLPRETKLYIACSIKYECLLCFSTFNTVVVPALVHISFKAADAGVL